VSSATGRRHEGRSWRHAPATLRRAAEEIERIAATHGPIGYPAAVGMAAGMATSEPHIAAKTADFLTYSQRFTERRSCRGSSGGVGCGVLPCWINLSRRCRRRKYRSAAASARVRDSIGASTNPNCHELDSRGGKTGEHGERDPGSRQMKPAPACPYPFNTFGYLALRKPPKR
jgi:hypothetical protein